MDQLPEEVRVHVLGGGSTHLHFGYRNQHLIADDFHFVSGILAGDTLRSDCKLELYGRI